MESFAASEHESTSSICPSQIIAALGSLGERLLLVPPSWTDFFNDSKAFWHAWKLLQDVDVSQQQHHLNVIKEKLEAQGPWLELAPQAISRTDLDSILREFSTTLDGIIGHNIPEPSEETTCSDTLFRVLLRVIHSKAWKEEDSLPNQQLFALVKSNPLLSCEQQSSLEREFVTAASSLLGRRQRMLKGEDEAWTALEYARMAVETLGPFSTVKEVNSVKTLCLS